MHTFSGFSSLIIVVILAVLSGSIMALSVDKSYRQSKAIIHQKQQFDTEIAISNALSQAVFNFIASGRLSDESARSDAISSLSVSMITNEHNIDGKNLTLIDLSASNTLDDAIKIRHSVSMTQVRRLERVPDEATKVWSVSSVNSLTETLFTLPFTHFTAFRESADYGSAHCDDFPRQVHGFIWIGGNCTLDRINLGSAKRPVILVVEGNIQFADVTLHGLLVHLCTSTSPSLSSLSLSSIAMSSTTVNGGLVSSCTDDPTTSLPAKSSVSYNPRILDVLAKHSDNLLTQVVKGSWQFQ
jgi:hypothetical protein